MVFHVGGNKRYELRRAHPGLDEGKAERSRVKKYETMKKNNSLYSTFSPKTGTRHPHYRIVEKNRSNNEVEGETWTFPKERHVW